MWRDGPDGRLFVTCMFETCGSTWNGHRLAHTLAVEIHSFTRRQSPGLARRRRRRPGLRHDAMHGIGIPAPGTPTLLMRGPTAAGTSLVGSATTVSGLCPIAGPTEYVSPVQCAAYDAQKHINRGSIAILAASHAEGRWFEREFHRGRNTSKAGVISARSTGQSHLRHGGLNSGKGTC